MPKLSNHLLREKSVKDFLVAMNIELTGVVISSVEELLLFSFNNAESAENFTNKLNAVIQADSENKAVKSLSLSEIVDSEIVHAASSDSTNLAVNRASCNAILEIIKAHGAHFVFSQESGLLELTLPNPAYATMLNLLKYPHLTFSTDGKLILDIKKYLQNVSETMVKITGFNSNQPPLLFLNSNALEAKQIYYATKALNDGQIEVTPYFFVPHTITPPTYHFVLDVSGSMRTSLADLKKSVKSLAQQLFIFQPNAELTITTFSNGVHSIGTFKADQLGTLNHQIDAVELSGDTPLYEATAKFLNLITDDQQNNILLFTDGEENGSKPGSEFAIRTKINSLGSELSVNRVRNKFYIFSYNVHQDSLMHEVARTFLSEVVETSSADFVAAQEDPELLKKWAAARELFSMRLVVTEKQGTKSTTQYQKSLDMSGQLASLGARICQPGETIEIAVFDGNGKTVLQSSKNFIEKPILHQEVQRQILEITSSDQSKPLGLEPDPEKKKITHNQHDANSNIVIPQFFLNCVDRCIELFSAYANELVHSCPSYFPPDSTNWQTNGLGFFARTGINVDYSSCSLQIADSSVPQIGFPSSSN